MPLAVRKVCCQYDQARIQHLSLTTAQSQIMDHSDLHDTIKERLGHSRFVVHVNGYKVKRSDRKVNEDDLIEVFTCKRSVPAASHGLTLHIDAKHSICLIICRP